MEYGFVPKVEQYRDNKALQLQQVNSASETAKLSEKKNLEELNRQDFLLTKESSETEKVKEKVSLPKFEYTLTNTNFGFNDDSKDFFVRVTRGKQENQYPTEDMMKLKAYIINNENA